jgi:hypothetical protein
VVLTGLTGVGQWTRGLVFRYVLGSEGCVLVPRSSGTPVAAWAWPIWVVSRRRVLEAVFILLEFPSPSRRIFIGSHSLPPSLVRRREKEYSQLKTKVSQVLAHLSYYNSQHQLQVFQVIKWERRSLNITVLSYYKM